MPYLIYLEHDTEEFATACPPLFGSIPADNILGRKRVKRSNQNTSRTGRIDVAVYSNNQGIEIPICAIEVKGFNPNNVGILDDLCRNREYFSKTSITGSSQIQFTLFVALHSYKKTMSDDKEQSNKAKLEKRYKTYIEQLGLSAHISNEVEVFTIRRGVMPDIDDQYVQEMGLEGNEDYHFLGVIVCFKNMTV